MDTVREIATAIVAREGGFSNDPDDPGGPTNHGVTLATLRSLGIELTGDGRITIDDVRKLGRDQAIDIFVEHYHKRPGIGNLPNDIQASLFDMYVNAGSNAVKVLQRLLTQMGFDCTDDGVIGQQTIRASQLAMKSAPHHLADAYAIARRNYYYALADARPASRKYARRKDGGKGGWIVRAEAFMAPKYQFSLEQHKTRVAAWG